MALFSIYVQNVDKTMRELKKVDVETYNASITTIQGAMSKAQTSARVRYPDSGYNTADGQMRGWVNKKGTGKFPHYNQRQAMAGVKTVVNKKTSKSKSSYRIAALVQRNAGGVIYDMAGSKTNGNGRAGVQFVGLLTKIGNKASRVMWPAVCQNQNAVISAIKEATAKAERIVNGRQSNF